jgi:hypothetical protein
VFAQGDRRRRAMVRLPAADVRLLEADGVIEARGDGAFALTAAGLARVARKAVLTWRGVHCAARDVG